MERVFWITLLVMQSTAQETSTESASSSRGPLLCNPASFKLTIADSFHYDRAEKISIQNNKEEECASNPQYVWTVYQLNTDQNPGQVTHVKIENVLDFDGPSDKTENQILLSRADVSVELYFYKFLMSVQLIPAAGWNPWFQNKTFLAKPYNMLIMLKGLQNRIHLYKSEDLVLDSSPSSDKSYRDNGVEAMKKNDFKWTCQPPSVQAPHPGPPTWLVPDEVLKELLAQGIYVIKCTVAVHRRGTPFFPVTRSNRQTITLMKPPSPEIKLTCTNNCDSPDAFQKTTVFFECVSHCPNRQPEWTFEPYNETIAKNYLTNNQDGYLTFQPGAFRPGDKLKIEATLGDVTVSLTLVFRVPEPVLALTCVENCEYEPRAETILRLECQSDCDNLDPVWETSRADLDHKAWLTDTTMKIEPGVFKDEDNLIVVVTSYGSIAKLDATFREKVPDLALTCQLFDTKNCAESPPDPREAVHLTVECKSNCNYLDYTWIIDPEPLGHDIESNLNPPDRNVMTIDGNTFTDGQHVKITVSSGKTSVTFSTTYVAKVPELAIECLSNCDRDVGNTMEETKLKPVCTANCNYLEYVWAVNAHSPARVKTWVGEENVLVIPPGTLIDGENTFTLTSGKASATLTKHYEKPVPELSITCEANCIDPNPTKETVVKVHCLSPPNVCVFEYKWLITPQNFIWMDKATFSGNRTVLTIKPNTFKDTDTIEFKVTDGDKAEAILTLSYTEPVPKLSIACDKNCDPSHPLYLTELRVICENNCEADYVWEFEPKPANPIKAIVTSGHIVTIAGEAYGDETSVTATVTSGKGTATFTLNYKIQPPVLQLLCHPPCEEPHDPKDSIVVNVTCTNYCPKVLKYIWKIEPEDYDKKKVVFQKNLESFILLSDTFADGIIATVTVSTQEENETPKVLTFSEVPPDISMHCVENCWEATPLLDTVLSATCTDFCKNIDSYEWTLEPAPAGAAGIIYAPKKANITIKPEMYKDLDVVDVTLSARNANVTKQLTFFELPAVLTVSCLENCNPSNPFEDVVLEVNCTDNCYKLAYEWDKVEPEPSGWDVKAQLSKKNSVMTILKKFFKDGDAHRFFVTSRKGSANYDVRFAVPPAELTLACTTQCHPFANPLMTTTIQAMCLRFCYDDYQWSLSPLAEGLVLPESKGPNNTLDILPEMYPDQGSVQVKIFTAQSEILLDIYFVEPTPQLNLTCVSCENGTLNPFFEAIFNATCLRFCDYVKYTWEFSPTSETITYGPDNITATIPKSTYEDKQQLLVTVHGRKGKADLSVTYHTPPGYIVIACANQNCPYANPLKPAVFNLTCFFDCEGLEWVWEIQPRDPNFDWDKKIQTDEKKTTLTILPEAFGDGQVVQLSAWADGSNHLQNKSVIKFEEPMPSVSITCVKNCEPYSSLQDVEVKATCVLNCELPKYEWTLEPESIHVILANNDQANFIIKAGSYYFNDTVTILLKFRKARVNKTITFGAAGWDGECFFEPNGGVSGVTQFAIGCDYFQDGVTYRAYQDYPGNELGVLLTYGQSKFLDYVYLSAGKSSLTVIVGNGFATKRQIRMKVGTVRPVPEAGSEELYQKIMGEGHEDFSGMVKRRRNVQKTVQFASLLWTALEGVRVRGADATHYNKHIIAGINTLSDKIEPFQLMSLFSKFLKTAPADMLTIRLLTEGIQKSVDYAITRKNSSLYQNDEALPGFCKETLSLLSTLMGHTLSQSKKQPKPFPRPDYRTKIDFEPTRADFRRNLRKFTHDLIETTEALPQLFLHDETVSKQINLKIGELSASDTKNPTSFRISGSKSHIQTTPNFGFNLEATGVAFKYAFGYFATDPFWWQDLGINTDVVQFSADWLPGPIILHLSLKKKKQGEFSGKVSDEIVYEFTVKPRALFTASFTTKTNAYGVKMYPRYLETVVKGNEILDYVIEEEKFVYVVITALEGKPAEYAVMYQMLECFSWPTGSLGPTKSGCKALNKVPDFVSCECSHLSLFAGKQSIPQISTQTTETLRSGPIVPNPFIPITIAVLFLIFLLLAGYAFYKDGKEKTPVVFIQDNQPGDCELYLINIATGITTTTTSDVAIEITGTEAKSRIHLIQSETNQPFNKRNDEHFFAMYTEKHLGDLVTICMWTNSKGSKPNWYCERVMIEHLATRKKYLFQIEKSFSLIEGECSETFAIASTKLKFWQRFREAVRDNHHLLTLFTQRPRGVNKETVAIAYATCSFAMFVALVLTIYAPEIAIVPTAAISAVVTIPVTFFLNHLFRNSS